MSESTRSRAVRKDFPLWKHPSGRWCRKSHGTFYYFGKVTDDPQGEAALLLWLDQKDDILAGRKPQSKRPGAITLADVCNAYLARAEKRRDAGEISSRTFDDYHDACKLIVRQLGRNVDPAQLRPVDFMGLRDAVSCYSPGRMNKIIGIARMVMRWAFESELIEGMPRFGPDFKGVTKRKVRQQKAAAGAKLFTPDQLRTLISNADVTMRAMILLGINGALGNTDVASLPQSAVNLKTGWIDFPRPKTGIPRRFALWPETIEALRESLLARPQPSGETLAGLVFLTKYGNSWVPEGRRDNQVSAMFRKLLRKSGIERGGFYWLRHSFQTIADDAADPIATAHVMGHADGTIGGVYRERISDERLRRVTDHVRDWLYPPQPDPGRKPEPSTGGKPQLRIVG